MRLTLYTDYSLRLLLYLAVKPDGLATIEEVAKAYGVSRNHLMKVAHELGRAGFVATVRGRGGGLRLARPPEAVSVGEVVRFAEDDFRLALCFEPGAAACAISPACRLRGALAEARNAFLAVLDGYTLAAIAEPGDPVRALLGIAAGPRPAMGTHA
ncbi:Rrf2 family transcriptional regulator [Propylenella binzhouense]|uniref:Rrf2 family transcriptional regulator n=1 Tax=Propylenella binzhouense TaxID=2555902 RepID=UPI0031B5AA56